MMENKNIIDIIDKAAPDPFFSADGKKIISIRELRSYLASANAETVKHHLGQGRNDFANWIRNDLKEDALASRIYSKQTKEELIIALDGYFSDAEKKPVLMPIPEHILRPVPARPLAHQMEQAKSNRSLDPEDDIPEIIFVKTGVPGFDEMITGGIPKGSAVLLCGGPGTGKTTFSLNLICNAAKRGERCLYLTFEEDAVNLRRHMKNYGWVNPTEEAKNNIRIRKMHSFDLSRSVEALLAKASGELTIELDEVEGIIPKDFKPDIIILDSLSAVAAAFTGKDEGYRVYIEQLFSLFKRIGATAFLITEIEQDTARYSKSGVEEFLADTVIVFYNVRSKNIRINALEILKVRGTPHQKKIVPFKMIPAKGIVVYPMEEAFT